jgi:hypothetical protein
LHPIKTISDGQRTKVIYTFIEDQKYPELTLC